MGCCCSRNESDDDPLKEVFTIQANKLHRVEEYSQSSDGDAKEEKDEPVTVLPTLPRDIKEDDDRSWLSESTKNELEREPDNVPSIDKYPIHVDSFSDDKEEDESNQDRISESTNQELEREPDNSISLDKSTVHVHSFSDDKDQNESNQDQFSESTNQDLEWGQDISISLDEYPMHPDFFSDDKDENKSNRDTFSESTNQELEREPDNSISLDKSTIHVDIFSDDKDENESNHDTFCESTNQEFEWDPESPISSDEYSIPPDNSSDDTDGDESNHDTFSGSTNQELEREPDNSISLHKSTMHVESFSDHKDEDKSNHDTFSESTNPNQESEREPDKSTVLVDSFSEDKIENDSNLDTFPYNFGPTQVLQGPGGSHLYTQPFLGPRRVLQDPGQSHLHPQPCFGPEEVLQNPGINHVYIYPFFGPGGVLQDPRASYSYINFDLAQNTGSQRFDITNPSSLDAMQEIFDATWLHQEAGIGYDATGLQHSRLRVKEIYGVVNPNLFQKYMGKVREYQKVAQELPGGRFLPLESSARDVLAQNSVLTTQLSLNKVGDACPCDPKLNEVYLFHGTKEQNVNGIIQTGFDLQRARTGKYGKALYFAESAQKSDQYADSWEDRKAKGLHMFVVRVILGRSFVNTTNEMINADNIPCTKGGCMTPGCTIHPYFFDSVVSGKGCGGELARHREFTLHDADRCLPQYLIVYDRVAQNLE